jgi:hypothetical protein
MRQKHTVYIPYLPTLALLSAIALLPKPSFGMSKAMNYFSSPAAPTTDSSPTFTPDILPATSSAPAALSGNNRAILFGGNCDEGAKKNSFLPAFNLLASGLVKNGWDVRPLYEGDIARCSIPANDSACQGSSPSLDCCPAYADMSGWSPDSLAAASGKPASTIGRASAREFLNSLDQASQDLKSGDQLLISINTHGFGYAQSGTTETKHYICVSSDDPHGKVTWTDPNTGSIGSAKSGLFPIDDPQLLSRLQKLKDAGVKLAFLNDSCFSGGTIPSFAQYGCVMSATGSQQENMSVAPSGTVYAGNNKTMTVTSWTDTNYNLADLLTSSPSKLAQLSLTHSNRLTMEELWLRMLSHSRMAGDTPEFSGYIEEQRSIDDLNTWFHGLDYDVTYRSQKSPYASCTDCSKDSSQPLQDYGSQFLTPFLDSAKNQNYFAVVQNYWPAPGYTDTFDEIKPLDPSSISAKLTGISSQWSALEAQYSGLASRESAALEDLKSVNMNIQLNFDGALAGTEGLFNTIAASSNGTSVFFYSVSPSGPGLLEVMDNFSTPDDSDFASETLVALGSVTYKMNAYKLQHDSFLSGIPDSYQGVLADMMVKAETAAWNNLSQDAKNTVKKDFKILSGLRNQERILLGELPTNASTDLVEARMYSYLSFRDRSARTNSNLNQCSDFTFRNF